MLRCFPQVQLSRLTSPKDSSVEMAKKLKSVFSVKTELYHDLNGSEYFWVEQKL